MYLSIYLSIYVPLSFSLSLSVSYCHPHSYFVILIIDSFTFTQTSIARTITLTGLHLLKYSHFLGGLPELCLKPWTGIDITTTHICFFVRQKISNPADQHIILTKTTSCSLVASFNFRNFPKMLDLHTETHTRSRVRKRKQGFCSYCWSWIDRWCSRMRYQRTSHDIGRFSVSGLCVCMLLLGVWYSYFFLEFIRMHPMQHVLLHTLNFSRPSFVASVNAWCLVYPDDSHLPTQHISSNMQHVSNIIWISPLSVRSHSAKGGKLQTICPQWQHLRVVLLVQIWSHRVTKKRLALLFNISGEKIIPLKCWVDIPAATLFFDLYSFFRSLDPLQKPNRSRNIFVSGSAASSRGRRLKGGTIGGAQQDEWARGHEERRVG